MNAKTKGEIEMGQTDVPYLGDVMRSCLSEERCEAYAERLAKANNDCNFEDWIRIAREMLEECHLIPEHISTCLAHTVARGIFGA